MVGDIQEQDERVGALRTVNASLFDLHESVMRLQSRARRIARGLQQELTKLAEEESNAAAAENVNTATDCTTPTDASELTGYVLDAHELTGGTMIKDGFVSPTAGIDCNVALGYTRTVAGTAPTAVACTYAGDVYTFIGCTATDCITPTDANDLTGYVLAAQLTGGTMTKVGFVSPTAGISCSGGYTRTNANTAPTAVACTNPGLVYTFTGCTQTATTATSLQAADCITPTAASELTGYVLAAQLTGGTMTKDGFVSPTAGIICNAALGYTRTDAETAPTAVACTHAGHVYTFTGCTATDCITPTDANDLTGYVLAAELTGVTIEKNEFVPPTADISCAAGYTRTDAGTAPTAVACTNAGHVYTLTGCTQAATTATSLQEQNFAIGENGQNDCPEGAVRLSSLAHCKLASKRLHAAAGNKTKHYRVVKQGSWRVKPKGCSRDTESGSLIFNTHATGYANENFAPICSDQSLLAGSTAVFTGCVAPPLGSCEEQVGFLAHDGVCTATCEGAQTPSVKSLVCVNGKMHPQSFTCKAVYLKEFDSDGDSLLSQSELQAVTAAYPHIADYLRSQGDEDIDWTRYYDANGDGKLSESELQALAVARPTIAAMIGGGLFELHGMDTNRNRILDASEVKAALLYYQSLLARAKVVDKNGDGQLTPAEATSFQASVSDIWQDRFDGGPVDDVNQYLKTVKRFVLQTADGDTNSDGKLTQDELKAMFSTHVEAEREHTARRAEKSSETVRLLRRHARR